MSTEAEKKAAVCCGWVALGRGGGWENSRPEFQSWLCQPECCVILGEAFPLSELQSPHLYTASALARCPLRTSKFSS